MRTTVPLIFDAAHALGASLDGVPIGSFGTAEVFSLTPTKPLVAGEGGLVATNDAEPRRDACASGATTATPATTTPGSPG